MRTRRLIILLRAHTPEPIPAVVATAPAAVHRHPVVVVVDRMAHRRLTMEATAQLRPMEVPTPVTPTPSVPTPVTPTPRVPTPLTPSHGGSHSSPPSHGRGSGNTTRPVTPTPSVPTPVTPTPRVPTPLTPTPILTPPSIPNFPPITGTCDFWRTNPSLVWGILGFWRNIGHMFGMPATNVFGGNPTVRNALENTRTDGYGALLREGTASFLNSMASHSFPFTTQRVKESFTASLVSEKAAAAQAKRFRKANEGHYKN